MSSRVVQLRASASNGPSLPEGRLTNQIVLFVKQVLSECIVERFDRKRIFPYIKPYRMGEGDDDRAGGMGASLIFFPVDNTKSDGEGGVDPVLAAVRAAVQEVIEDPENAFTKRTIPLSWYELHEELQIQTEEHGLKRTTRGQVQQWAAECGMGCQPGVSLEAETDGFLQLMHAYGLAVWHSEPQLRGVVVLDPQWLVDAISTIIRDFKLHSLPDIDAKLQKDPTLFREWTRYRGTGYLAAPLLHAFWAQYSALERAFLDHMMQKFNLIVPMRPRTQGAAVELFVVPAMLKPAPQPPSLLPSAEPGALTCYLCFGAEPDEYAVPNKIWLFGSAPAASPASVQSFRLDFLPSALLPRLQVRGSRVTAAVSHESEPFATHWPC